MKPVSTETEQRLRAALVRLLTGEAIVTDGRLTVANLAREAGVGRATANRASVVLTELRIAIADQQAAVQPVTLADGKATSNHAVQTSISLPSTSSCARCYAAAGTAVVPAPKTSCPSAVAEAGVTGLR